VLPYDWRLSFDDILDSGQIIDGKVYYDDIFETTKPYILERLRRLADSSATGKVTIVAHSTGGLITKKLLYDIENDANHPYRDLLEKIDRIILAAVPQLGTPKAAAALLHGYDTEIDIPVVYNFMSQETARALGKNMYSAHALLPSLNYMNRVKDITEAGEYPPYTAIISFDEESLKILDDPFFDYNKISSYYQSNYGTTTINTYPALRDFLLGAEGRQESAENDIDHPIKLKNLFLNYTESIHQQIDNWAPPDTNEDGNPDTEVIQIAGWGIADTLKGFQYFATEKRAICSTILGCIVVPPALDIKPLLTFDGDGTVAIPSAVAMGTTTDKAKGLGVYYVDLFNYNEDKIFDRDHKNILEVGNVRELIANIIREKDNPAENLKYITEDPTTLAVKEPYIRLSLHSPVKIDVYDGQENHLGISASTTEGIILLDQEIPNSYYLRFGEGKYLGFPATDDYRVELKGLTKGAFTLKLEEVIGEAVQQKIVYKNIPVTQDTAAKMNISTLSEASGLLIDFDGDGETDVKIEPGEEVSLEDRVKILRAYILSLDISRTLKKHLLRRIKTAEKIIKKENFCAAKAILQSIQQTVERKSNRGINPDDAIMTTSIIQEIIEMIDCDHLHGSHNKCYNKYHGNK